MKSLAALLTVATLLTAPATAQTLTVLLPDLDYPTGDVTSSSKGCTLAETSPVCVPPQE